MWTKKVRPERPATTEPPRVLDPTRLASFVVDRHLEALKIRHEYPAGDPAPRVDIAHGEEDFVIRRGERIAQLVIAPVVQAAWVETDSLDETARGAGGFGSTGR